MTTRGAGTGYWLGFALVVGGLALVPLGLPEFWRRFVTEILIWGLLAMSSDLLIGYTGMVSFGHSAFFGLGMYGAAFALLALRPPRLWAALVATSWRHVGYIMVIYLAGLKSVDPALREAAKVDGASERQTFFRVVFPAMAPINVVIVVVTVIEALRAFDIVYIINKGKNGLELLSTLITNNGLSESNRVGFASAIAVVLLLISLIPIIAFLSRTMREERR